MCSPSSCHDATHVKMSPIWHKMHNDELPNKLQFKLDDEQNTIVWSYLLGDSAYPICVGLLKCFTTKGISVVQWNPFDSKWRAERARIKNAFGILKKKFQKKLNCNLKYHYGKLYTT